MPSLIRTRKKVPQAVCGKQSIIFLVSPTPRTPRTFGTSEPPHRRKSLNWKMLSSLGGLRDGSLFGFTPTFVNEKERPGTSSQPQSWAGWWLQVVSLRFFFASPNLTWCLVAGTVWFLFPYTFDEVGVLHSHATRAFFVRRFLVHLAVVGCYYGFWHVTLYHGYCSCGKRKFRGVKGVEKNSYVPPNYPYPGCRTMIHNIWYWSLGVLQWTCWEVAFVHLYATRKISYRFSFLELLVGVLFVPLWRGFHFYFSHRFLHIRPMYKFVHSLHHRNVDVEPFAGLCMHPVEHLFYYACLAPTIWYGGHPFLMLWNGYHLLLSPAASHSGWEDHFQSDQFHYLHHARFECNYGSASMPFDFSSGTFRDKMRINAAPLSVEKNRHRPVISWSDLLPATIADLVYSLATLGIATVLLGRIAGGGMLDVLGPKEMGMLVAIGPVIAAMVLWWTFGDSLQMTWPFHKEKVLGKFGIHFVLGVCLTCLPVYQVVVLLVSP